MYDFFECLWPIAEDGYEIVVIPAKEGGGILASDYERRVIRPVSGNQSWRHYDPMRSPPEGEPLLFRTFADLEETEEAVIEFANRFGVLSAAWESRNKDEDIGDWFGWIRGVRRHIEMAKAGTYRADEWTSTAAEAGVYRTQERLSASANFEENSTTPVQFALTPDGKNGGMAFKLRLPSLRAALWTQLGMWVSKPGMNQRKCHICGHWFTYGPSTGKRSNANYCRRECVNTANYYKRKEQG